MDCGNLEYIDIGKKKKIRRCKAGKTATYGYIHYCEEFKNISVYL
jgi:hypothetical protein